MQKVQSGACRLHGVKLTDKEKAKENIFFFGFIFYLIARMWTSTEFVQNGTFMQASFIVMVLCMAAKILLFDRYSAADFIVLIIAMAVGVGIYLKMADTLPFALMLLVFGAKGIDPVKIIKVHACVTGAMLIIAFVGANLDIISNWQYFNKETGNTESAYGIINTTDFAAHVCFLWLEVLYIKCRDLKYYHYFIGIGGAFVLYKFTGARIDSACVLAATLLFLLDNYMTQHLSCIGRIRLESVRSAISAFAMPFCMALMFVLSFLYNASSKTWAEINNWTSERLNLAQKAFETYSVTPFGQTVPMYGNGGGGKDTWPSGAEYFFVDISYQNILLTQGILFLILILLAYFYMSYKRKSDRALLLCIIITAVNCMIAHHLAEIAYVPFALLLFAKDRADVGELKHKSVSNIKKDF